MKPSGAAPYLLAACVVFSLGALLALRPHAAEERSAAAGAEFVGESKHCVSGLDDVRRLCSPAIVDHDRCMEATPQHARLEREKIDPRSALGQILLSEARRRVTSACTTVMKRHDHCSIWRELRRADGGDIPDRTDDVRAHIAGDSDL